MTREDHRELLSKGVLSPGGTWADLGSGTGAFTAALAELIGGEGTIISVDRDGRALREQGERLGPAYPRLDLRLLRADFTRLTDVPPLDGAIMANSLHFQEDAAGALRTVLGWLKPGAGLIVIEYDVESASHWVPYPMPSSRLAQACASAGFTETRLLATRPSMYHGRVYSMLCVKGGAV